MLNKKKPCQQGLSLNGTPCRARTYDPLIKSQLLYRPELKGPPGVTPGRVSFYWIRPTMQPKEVAVRENGMVQQAGQRRGMPTRPASAARPREGDRGPVLASYRSAASTRHPCPPDELGVGRRPEAASLGDLP